jgi:hypothetical protein
VLSVALLCMTLVCLLFSSLQLLAVPLAIILFYLNTAAFWLAFGLAVALFVYKEHRP